jgi:superfamily II helicase
MKQRLQEELIDMSGTCSSGFASRLVNVISGFGDFNLTISWRDQLVANFTGRLNAKARDIASKEKLHVNTKLYNIIAIDEEKKEDMIKLLEDFQGKVLEEMTINTNDFASRRNFLKFFRKNMLGIRQELYEEFKTFITDTDFDLYCRAAIATYETGGYV